MEASQHTPKSREEAWHAANIQLLKEQASAEPRTTCLARSVTHVTFPAAEGPGGLGNVPQTSINSVRASIPDKGVWWPRDLQPEFVRFVWIWPEADGTSREIRHTQQSNDTFQSLCQAVHKKDVKEMKPPLWVVGYKLTDGKYENVIVSRLNDPETSFRWAVLKYTGLEQDEKTGVIMTVRTVTGGDMG
ncbi:hypothetical protein N0V87_010498 [Didymella glomerata]|uniref:Uncharacterized protein n=1 Tax=Didymella glomerata TaxID=749621 RepID=A0A9W9BUM4_9PLEO|nr:hypothetical protein N0V87_010498 [Didymella glomerata]